MALFWQTLVNGVLCKIWKKKNLSLSPSEFYKKEAPLKGSILSCIYFVEQGSMCARIVWMNKYFLIRIIVGHTCVLLRITNRNVMQMKPHSWHYLNYFFCPDFSGFVSGILKGNQLKNSRNNTILEILIQRRNRKFHLIEMISHCCFEFDMFVICLYYQRFT